MTFEELIKEWSKDADISFTDLGNESLKIAKLHHKYYSFYLREKSRYYNIDAEYKRLKLDKYEFLTMGPTEETKDYGWRLPPQGRILKAEVQQYLDADKDLSSLLIKMNMQKEKLDFIESIIKNLGSRSFNIKTALDWEKFKNGS